jgi:transposase-like protein
VARRSSLSAAEKAEVVLQYLRREESAAKLARRYGISEQTLYRYRDEFIAAGKAGLAGNVDAERRVQQLEQAVAEREQIIGELTIANRILKKRADGSA